MHPDNVPEFLALLSKGAQHLRGISVERSGGITVNYVDAPLPVFAPPDLNFKGSLAGVDLADIPRLLYTSPGLDGDAVIDTFDAIARERMGAAATRERWRRLLPHHPLAGNAAFVVGVGALRVAAWSGVGRLWWRSREMLLRVNDVEIGYDHLTTVLSDGTLRREHSRISVHEALSVPQGRAIRPHWRLAAVREHMLRMVSKNAAPSLDRFFRAATHAGPSFEAAVYGIFDINRVNPNQLDDDVQVAVENLWDRARRLVNTATVPPHADLYELLRYRLPIRVFRRFFGDNYRPPKNYTEEMRRRHLRSIDELEIAYQDESRFIEIINERAAKARSLLDLQQLLR